GLPAWRVDLGGQVVGGTAAGVDRERAAVGVDGSEAADAGAVGADDAPLQGGGGGFGDRAGIGAEEVDHRPWRRGDGDAGGVERRVAELVDRVECVGGGAGRRNQAAATQRDVAPGGEGHRRGEAGRPREDAAVAFVNVRGVGGDVVAAGRLDGL